jgi:CheY-like chemotaxis protein
MSPNTSRVLLVDGAVDEREMYAEYFRTRGFLTLQAGTADDGFRLAAELQPDVIITVMMIVRTDDGLTLTRRLKAHEETKSAPVVMLTGYVGEADRLDAEQAGCDRFLSKPCFPDVLADAVEELMTAHASERSFRDSPRHETP